jgi:hypothetical protein
LHVKLWVYKSFMKNKLKLILIPAFLFSISIFSQEQKEDQSQEKKKEENKPEPKPANIWDNFVFGGNIGLQIGSVTSIEASPSVGYYFTPRLLSGIGGTYQYYKQTVFNSESYTHVASIIFGIRVFSCYTVIENIGKNLVIKQNFAIYTQGEYEGLSLDRDFSNVSSIGTVNRFWLHGFLVGGGIKQPLGKKRSSFNITILYNLTATKKTPYENPIIRLGFFF